MRIGSKKRPFYRVVAIDEQKKRSGNYLELLGTYNPLTEPKEIILKQDAIDAWVKKGAVLSSGFLRIIGKAPQKPPRKPRKAPAEPAAPKAPEAAAVSDAVQENKVEEVESNSISENKDEATSDVANSENVANTEEPVVESETSAEKNDESSEVAESNSVPEDKVESDSTTE